MGYYRDDAYFMREARLNQVPVAAVIMSWDNTTSWGLGGAWPEHVIAQTEIMRHELMELHGVAHAKITVEGIPYFGPLFPGPKPLPSREDTFGRLGLDPAKRLIFLGHPVPHHISLGIRIWWRWWRARCRTDACQLIASFWCACILCTTASGMANRFMPAYWTSMTGWPGAFPCGGLMCPKS